MALIEFKSVSLGYGGEPVVEDLSFAVERGDYLCIVGENGSGKSTLVKTLLGLIPPREGEIIRGEGLKKCEMGYLPQGSAPERDFPASVLEVVLSGCLGACTFFPFYSSEQKAFARKNMELLDISNLEKKCYRELSGGQQQRVLIARALCASSRLLLLDEPETALDVKTMRQTYSLISQLKDEGVTVITVSHNISHSLEHASHVLHLAHKPRFFGRAKDYLKSDAYLTTIRGGRAK